MRRRHIAAALLVAVLAACSADAAERWFHVEVRDRGREAARVMINLPAAIVARSVPEIPFDDVEHCDLRVGCASVAPRDIHALWRTVASGGSGEVLIDGIGVTAERQGTWVVLRHSGSAWCEPGEVRVPLALVAALVSTPSEDRVNVRAAIVAISRMTDADVLLARGDDSTVRVWIDQSPSGGKR